MSIFVKFSYVVYDQLIHYNVHFGHSVDNTLFFSSWLLLGLWKKIWIINLSKTLYMLKLSFKLLKFLSIYTGLYDF